MGTKMMMRDPEKKKKSSREKNGSFRTHCTWAPTSWRKWRTYKASPRCRGGLKLIPVYLIFMDSGRTTAFTKWSSEIKILQRNHTCRDSSSSRWGVGGETAARGTLLTKRVNREELFDEQDLGCVRVFKKMDYNSAPRWRHVRKNWIPQTVSALSLRKIRKVTWHI